MILLKDLIVTRPFAVHAQKRKISHQNDRGNFFYCGDTNAGGVVLNLVKKYMQVKARIKRLIALVGNVLALTEHRVYWCCIFFVHVQYFICFFTVKKETRITLYSVYW